jgi:hypothetical protein
MVPQFSSVILGWYEMRKFWKVRLDQSNGPMPPDCYSPDTRRGIGEPGGDCLGCRYARFGSDPRGEGQACKLFRELFVLRPENLLPDIVNLPASSLNAARLYLRRLSQKGRPCYSLVTKIGLEKTKNSQAIGYSRATFAPGEPLSPEQLMRAKEYASMLKSFIDAALQRPVTKTPRVAEGEVV